MEYLSVREISYKWNVSERWVSKLAQDGRIPGVEWFNWLQAISKDAEKHADPRIAKEKKAMTYEEAVQAIQPGRYRHFKGNTYEVIGIAKHSETEEPMVVYRALYGEGGLWVRPADMWNEQITRDGKTYHRFYHLDRIERVEKYERLFDEAATSLNPEILRLLDAYYTSGEWQEDYEADERGDLPPEMKRGVLSQHAMYDLLEGARL